MITGKLGEFTSHVSHSNRSAGSSEDAPNSSRLSSPPYETRGAVEKRKGNQKMGSNEVCPWQFRNASNVFWLIISR